MKIILAILLIITIIAAILLIWVLGLLAVDITSDFIKEHPKFRETIRKARRKSNEDRSRKTDNNSKVQ